MAPIKSLAWHDLQYLYHLENLPWSPLLVRGLLSAGGDDGLGCLREQVLYVLTRLTHGHLEAKGVGLQGEDQILSFTFRIDT